MALITDEDRALAARDGLEATCPLHKECWEDVKIVQVTGCLDVWPSTVNCPPDGSLPLTIWGKGFGEGSSGVGPFATTNEDNHGESDSRVHVFIGGARCEDLRFYNATEYGFPSEVWQGHQLLICNNYLGWEFGDFEADGAHGPGGHQGPKLTDRLGGDREKEGLNLPVTVVNRRDNINQTRSDVTVSFAFYPRVHHIDNCGETNETLGGCPTDGKTPLEIIGQYFIGYGGFGDVEVKIGPYPCRNVIVRNDTNMICMNYAGQGYNHRVRVKANGVWDRSPWHTYMSYRPVPKIEQISGCYAQGMGTEHCSRDGDQILTIVGYDLWVEMGPLGENHTVIPGEVLIGGETCRNVVPSQDLTWQSQYGYNQPDPEGKDQGRYYRKRGTVLRCYGYPWRPEMGEVGRNVTLKVRLQGELNREDTWIMYSSLQVSRVSGCMDFPPSTANCHSLGLQTITLTGKGFGTKGARVRFGPFECGTVRQGYYFFNGTTHYLGQEDSRLECSDYMSPASLPSYYPGERYHPFGHPDMFQPGWANPTVMTEYGINFTDRRVTVGFARRPEVLGISGCRMPPGFPDPPEPNRTRGCYTNGTMGPIFIRGRYFMGTMGFGEPQIWFGPHRCQRSILLSDTEMRCDESPGEGQDLLVEVRRSIVGTEWGTHFVERSGPTGLVPFVNKFIGRSDLPALQEVAQWMSANLWREDIRLSYRPKPRIRSISGCGCPPELNLGLAQCDLESVNHTVLCPTKGDTRITLTGLNFGLSGAEVWIGTRAGMLNTKCDTVEHDATSPDQIIYCFGYRFAGEGLLVSVVAQDEESEDPIFLSFIPSCPFWNAQFGYETIGGSNNGTMCNGHGTCDATCPTAPANCVCSQSDATGYWSGYTCQDCLYGYWGPECKLPCQGGAVRPCSNAGICTGGIYGDGQCICNPGVAGFQCEKPCPLDSLARVCGGFASACSNGTLGTGECTCPDDDAQGHWGGLACDTCISGWYADCKLQCPGGWDNACNKRGACDDGPTGNGTCTCASGYAGTRCEHACQGGPLNPCNFHGDCHPLTGRCTCYRDHQRGFWNGTACGVCMYGYSGPSTTPIGCITECPRNDQQQVCSHLGICDTGQCFCPATTTAGDLVCGHSCNITGLTCDFYRCDPGRWGQNCEYWCPGIVYPDPVFRPSFLTGCTDHGLCSEGKNGNGRCSCNSGWAGVGCSIECAGGWSNPCSGHGTCSDADGTCTCQSGYATASCGQACQGGALTPCGGHGTCSMGASGDGSCTCTYGYLGADCSIECPGGAATPCNFNGNCTDGICYCENDPVLGHWTGSACERCLPDWFGIFCLKTCPKGARGQNCSGHGTCPPQVEFCNCDSDENNGFWRGTICDQCQSGYWGAECKAQCPGGACNPCNGHGTCSEGVRGMGWCNCSYSDTDGWWSQGDCSDCKQGWWGPECKNECPGGWILPCSGHGTCSDGSFGSGSCACNSDPQAGGVWAGAVCQDCSAGWFSSNCSVQCPFFPVVGGRVCGGHGTCRDGQLGDGTCVCATSYAGHSCENVCPKDAVGQVCGGFLTACDDGRDGTAVCHCPTTPTEGYWQRPTCDDCIPGYGGATCTRICPGGSANPCSGHGTCSDGVRGDASCTCALGYTGAACTLLCPGSTNPCNGRGTCELDATCTCFNNRNLGFWAGEGCTTCLDGWSGATCRIGCPLAADDAGTITKCSGRGICIDGKCYNCDKDWCGNACEIGGPSDPTACSEFLCPTVGRYLPDCSGFCPATDLAVDPPIVCGGHGTCEDGKKGSGECFCDAGWAGRGCSIECDGGAVTPCSGHGICNQTWSGKCTCQAYYALAGCSVACPGLGSLDGVCSGRGLCSMGSLGDGTCRCDFGWAGLTCEKECNGGAANPCSGHGECDAVTALCTCIDSVTLGHFGGAGCESCSEGWFGDSCLEVCPVGQGSTQGKQCVCNSGWAGYGCVIECIGGYQNPCSGNGKCNDTNSGDGRCTCDSGYRGISCAIRCAGHAATGVECAGHGVCQDDGSCECYSSKADGFWDPPACQSCFGDWFGPKCDQFCPVGPLGLKCSGHGQCGKLVGKCECRADTEAGFWFGEACETCQPGYWGAQCRSPCPGGACSPCSLHGTCSDGPLGDGKCTCFVNPDDGYWTGLKCDNCAQGRWGRTCQASCPGGITPETWCSGHGDCSQGTLGSGLCTCFSDDANGRWTGANCQDCMPGWWAANCSLKCPGAILPCSGRGVCSDKMAGTGRCTCYRGYAGEACSTRCPRGPAGDFCSGALLATPPNRDPIEACDWGAPGQLGKPNGGDGTCKCPGNTRLQGLDFGFLTGVACERCREGYAGPNCKVICPGVGGLGECTSHGFCEDGKSGTGICMCDSGYAADACDVVCVGGVIIPCNGRGSCQKGSVGPPRVEPGSCLCFSSVVRGYWAEPGCLDCAVGWSGQNCDRKCPISSGRVCSGHGECREGLCFCAATDGIPYCGTTCELRGLQACDSYYCAPGFFGPNCLQTCRGFTRVTLADGTVQETGCSGHGRCNEGKLGDGTCACDVGWAGFDCGIECRGGAANPCSGQNGFCNQVSGECDCKSGFAGLLCEIPCAGGAGLPCRGHGVCDEGAYLRGDPPAPGTGKCACDYGYAGLDCGSVCPGGVDTPCNLHGVCEADGFCRCVGSPMQGYWEGSACERCRPEWWGSNCDLPCVHGTSADFVCVCTSGYANANCSRECDGYISEGYTAVCAGHGSCNGGRLGDGSCNCQTGWVGSFCNLRCPGASEVCSGHGVCAQATAVCMCDDNPDRGHWAGQACDTCAVGWFGAGCKLTCASNKPHPVLCSGHGDCDPVKVQCICFANNTHGFWDAHDCHKCAPGYWGAYCENECPGGSCNPCAGHGQCSEGLCVGGTCEQGWGTCNCTANDVEGFWSTANCSECAFGYFSSLCDKFCPIGTGVTGVASICARRGTCSMGRMGNGLCTCDYAPAAGYWGGSACDNCWPGYYGLDCRYHCPGNVIPDGAADGRTMPCSGHGACNDGLSGTGVCVCDFGYAGPGCGIACPQGKVGNMEAPVVCTGHGICADGVDGDGTCACTTDRSKGYWRGAACGQCDPGYWGPECLATCPGNVANGQPCWNHGQCNDGVAGDGTCQCFFGYSTADCARTCDGGTNRPCNGRGECKQQDGTCACFGDPVRGYWAGKLCDSCLSGWSGGLCTLSCPTNSSATENGVPCTARGICRQGACYSCDAGTCHGALGACEVAGEDCLLDACGTAGIYGRDCNLPCPGGIGAATCSGHGLCSDGKKGTGLCACDPGYTNTDCGQQCPGPDGSPCNDRGVCVQSMGVDAAGNPLPGGCMCDAGYAQAACQRECPGGYHNPCSGHGQCDDGSTRNGTCNCIYGYAGLDCANECTGGALAPCNFRGICSKITGACNCNSTGTTGFWAGANCDECQQGWWGVNCTQVCVHGRSVRAVTQPGSFCFCEQDFARASCEYECPRGNDSQAQVCAGHGYCRDGSRQLGDCVCDSGYFTANCQRHCNPQIECAQPPTEFAHAQCNPLTGLCECQDDVAGHWDGIDCPFGALCKCDECKLFYWGDACDKECTCSRHGGCDRSTGECQCFRNEQYGFWAGTYCERCADGYVGFDCMSTNVRISRTQDTGPPVNFKMLRTDTGTVLNDGTYNLMYTGGQPILLFDSQTDEMISHMDLGSPVVEGWIAGEYANLATEDDFIWQFERGKRDLASAQWGQPLFTGLTATPSTGAGRRAGALASPWGMLGPELARGLFALNASARWAAPAGAEGAEEAEEGNGTVPDSAWRTLPPTPPLGMYLPDLEEASAIVDHERRFRTGRVLDEPMLTRDQVLALGPSRRAVPQAAAGFKLIAALDDSDVDLSYLVWTGSLGRKIYYHRVSAGLLVRIIDLSEDLVHISDATLAKEKNLIAVTGSTSLGKWEVVLINSASGQRQYVSRDYFVPDCMSCQRTPLPCCIVASAATVLRSTLYFAVRIWEGFKVVSVELNTGAVVEYITIQNMLTNNIEVTVLVIDDLSGSGYVFAHLDQDPSTCYKFNVTSLRVFGTVTFLRTGTAVERVLSADYNYQQRSLLCLASLGTTLKVAKLNLFALHTFTPDIADTRGDTVITVTGEGFANIGLTCCKWGTGAQTIFRQALSNNGEQILCVAPPDPTGDGGCAGQVLEITLRGGAECSAQSLGWSQNLLTVQRVPTPSVFSVTPNFNVYQGGNLVVIRGIGFFDSKFITCRWMSRDAPSVVGFSDRDAVYAGKNPAFVQDPTHPSHNLTFINSFEVHCIQPPSRSQQPTLIPAYLEVSLDGQASGYSTSRVSYDIYGKPAGLSPTDPTVIVRAAEASVIPDLVVQTVDTSGHRLGAYDQSIDRTPIVRDVFVRLKSVSPDVYSNRAAEVLAGVKSFVVQYEGEVHQVMRMGTAVFPNMTLFRPPSGTVTAEFVHNTTRLEYDATLQQVVSVVTGTWRTEITIRVLSGAAVALNINRQPSNVSNHATELPLTMQPILEFFDAANNTVTSPTEAVIGVVAEWVAWNWNSTTRANGRPIVDPTCPVRPGLCPCLPVNLRTLNYSHVPQDAEQCWSTTKSSAPTPTFVDKFGKVNFRSVTLVGFHGVIYKLRFRVTIPPALGDTIAPVMSTFIHVGRCSPPEQRYAQEYSDQCLQCPTGAKCDGTTHVTGDTNHWRSNNVSTTFYRCAGHDPCLSANASCNVTVCEDACAEGHYGVLCSACEDDYGKQGDQCVKCDPQETRVTLALVVVGIVILLCWVVHTNLKIKARQEMDLPILTKMLISHLQVSSRIGDFKTKFPGMLDAVFSTQKLVSSFSFQGSFIDCAGGGGMSQYPKFLAYMFMPVAIIIFSFFVASTIINIRRVQDLLEQNRKDRQARERKALRKRREGLEQVKQAADQEVLDLAGTQKRQGLDMLDDDSSDDDAMQPKKLAVADMQGVDPVDYEDAFEEETPPEQASDPTKKASVWEFDPAEKQAQVEEISPEDIDVGVEDGLAGRVGTAKPSLRTKSVAVVAPPTGRARRNPTIGGARRSVARGLYSGNQDDLAVREAVDRQEMELAIKDDLTDHQRAYIERSRKFTTTWLLAFIIVLYFVYPNLIQESSQMLLCKEYQWEDDLPYHTPNAERPDAQPNEPGVGRRERFLDIDLSINCGTAEYSRYRSLAVMFALGYGFGIPLLAAGIVRIQIIRSSQGFKGAVRQFGFLLMGYRENRWYWEAVVMIRKLLIVFISVFIEEPKLQTYVAMWAMSASLVAHMLGSPYDASWLTRLEAFSLTSIIVTLNFSLLYYWELQPLYELTLTFVIALLTIAVMITFVYFIASAFVKKVLTAVNNFRRRVQQRAVERARKSYAAIKARFSTVAGPARIGDEDDTFGGGFNFAAGSQERPITHASTLPNFDRITMLNRLFVLRGGTTGRPDSGREWASAGAPADSLGPPGDDSHSSGIDDPQGNMTRSAMDRDWRGPAQHRGIISPTLSATVGPDSIGLQGTPSAGPQFGFAPPTPPPGGARPGGRPRTGETIGSPTEVTEERPETSRDSLQFDFPRLIDDIEGATENTRFTRRQAKEEAIEGNIVHAAYMFCHLKSEGMTKIQGIHDADAAANFDNMAFGRRYAREYARHGRDLTGEQFDALWDQQAAPYLADTARYDYQP